MVSTLAAIGVAAFSAILGGLGATLLKKASGRGALLKIGLSWPFVFGVILYGLAMATYIAVLRFAQVSVLYPVIALSYVWALLFAGWILHEKITLWKGIGVGLIIVGVVLVTLL